MNEVKIRSLLLPGICPFFTPKGHVRQEGRTCRKRSWSAVVSEWLPILFICCPLLSNPMESNWSLVGIFCWFFSLSDKLSHNISKVQNCICSNSPFKSLCKSKMFSSFNTSPIFMLSTRWKYVISSSTFLMKSLVSNESKFETQGQTEKVIVTQLLLLSMICL